MHSAYTEGIFRNGKLTASTAAFFSCIQFILQLIHYIIIHLMRTAQNKHCTSVYCFNPSIYQKITLEPYKGTNNTLVNTCQLHIIIAEKSTALIFQNILYNAVSLSRVKSRQSYYKSIIFWDLHPHTQQLWLLRGSYFFKYTVKLEWSVLTFQSARSVKAA